MQEQMSDIEWEISQLWMAIDYYERARQETHFRKEAEKFEETIKKLNHRIKQLEDKQHEWEQR